MHQILLSPYFREEQQQRKGRRGVSWEGPWAPAWLFQVSGFSSLGGGVASWAWGTAGSQSFEGPFSPQSEMGRQWMDRCIWPGRGSRLEMSLESSPGGRGKARWVMAKPMQVMVVFWKQLRARWTGPQRPSFILLFLCKTRCQSLRHHQETSEPSAVVALSKGLRPCPRSHGG